MMIQRLGELVRTTCKPSELVRMTFEPGELVRMTCKPDELVRKTCKSGDKVRKTCYPGELVRITHLVECHSHLKVQVDGRQHQPPGPQGLRSGSSPTSSCFGSKATFVFSGRILFRCQRRGLLQELQRRTGTFQIATGIS